MSLPLAITVIALADIAIIALPAFVMSRASQLTPHLIAGDHRQPRRPQPTTRAHTQRQPARSSRTPASTPS